MNTVIIKPPRARKESAAAPLRLVVDSLSAEDKELLSYFHAIAHEVRVHVLGVVRDVSVNRPLIEPKPQQPEPSIRLVSGAGTRGLS